MRNSMPLLGYGMLNLVLWSPFIDLREDLFTDAD